MRERIVEGWRKVFGLSYICIQLMLFHLFERSENKERKKDTCFKSCFSLFVSYMSLFSDCIQP